jgi:hypothetical protein
MQLCFRNDERLRLLLQAMNTLPNLWLNSLRPTCPLDPATQNKRQHPFHWDGVKRTIRGINLGTACGSRFFDLFEDPRDIAHVQYPSAEDQSLLVEVAYSIHLLRPRPHGQSALAPLGSGDFDPKIREERRCGHYADDARRAHERHRPSRLCRAGVGAHPQSRRDIVVMDNLPANKGAAVRTPIEARGASLLLLLLLLPFLPDFNPIENACAKFKSSLRKAAARTEALEGAIAAVQVFTNECANYFLAAGHVSLRHGAGGRDRCNG